MKHGSFHVYKSSSMFFGSWNEINMWTIFQKEIAKSKNKIVNQK